MICFFHGKQSMGRCNAYREYWIHIVYGLYVVVELCMKCSSRNGWKNKTQQPPTYWTLRHNELFTVFLFYSLRCCLLCLDCIVSYLSHFVSLCLLSTTLNRIEAFYCKATSSNSHTYADVIQTDRQTDARERAHSIAFDIYSCSFVGLFVALSIGICVSEANLRVFYCIFGRKTSIHCRFNIATLGRIKRCAVVSSC